MASRIWTLDSGSSSPSILSQRFGQSLHLGQTGHVAAQRDRSAAQVGDGLDRAPCSSVVDVAAHDLPAPRREFERERLAEPQE